MKTKDLISLSDKVDEVRESFNPEKDPLARNYRFYIDVNNHNTLLKTSLFLGQFIHTDEEGNILEKPIEPKYKDYNNNRAMFDSDHYHYACNLEIYQEQLKQAEERLLFPGWEYENKSGGIIKIHHEEKNINMFFDKDRVMLSYDFNTITTISDLIVLGIQIKA